MSATERRTKILRYARTPYGLRGQFGQGDDELSFNGSTACGINAVQWVGGLHGQHATLDEIAKSVGYPTILQKALKIGFFEYQVINALRHMGIEYEAHTDLTANDLLQIMTHRGPIIYKTRYGVIPQWKFYHYAGHTADGKANGFARPVGEAGANQIVGAENVRHFVVGVSTEVDSHRRHRRVWKHDPNHGSKRRPELPPYDVTSEHQFEVEYKAFHDMEGYYWAAIPAKPVFATATEALFQLPMYAAIDIKGVSTLDKGSDAIPDDEDVEYAHTVAMLGDKQEPDDEVGDN